MNMKKKMLFVVNPGIVPSVTFVTCYEADDIGDRAETTAEKQPKSAKKNWTRAFTHLPVVMNRLVRQPLKRSTFRSRATA